MKQKELKLSEEQIRKACVDLLEIDGWRNLRTNPTSDRSRGKGFGEVGMADDLFIRYGFTQACSMCPNAGDGPTYCLTCRSAAQVLFIEWKAPKGKAAGHQLAWHEAERARGALTWIATIDFPPDYDGFKAHYLSSGLARSIR
jgi:hypothetical protein